MTLDEIEEKAYGMYHTAGKDHDVWREVRDMFLFLIEKSDDEEAVGYWNNTLGYIYYYGRCNDDWSREYEKAFKCFTIGAEAGNKESRYKLGDMYMNGYFVEKDEEKAVSYYLQVYEEVEPHFRHEYFGGEFADISLRLGTLYKNGIGCEKDEKKALFILTVADYAIKQRMAEEEFFGNQNVADSISQELTELQEKLNVKKADKIETDYPVALPLVFTDGFNGSVHFDIQGNSIIMSGIRFETIGEYEEGEEIDCDYDIIENLIVDFYVPRIPVIFSEYGFCDFFDEVVETAVGIDEFTVYGKDKEYIPCDEIRYNSERDGYEFLYDNKVRAFLKAKKYVFSFE